MVLIVFFLAGMVVILDAADTFLTRDGIKRSGGYIREKNKAMVWFMQDDFRAWGLFVFDFFFCVIASLLTRKILVLQILLLMLLVYIIQMKIRVCIKNYRLNTKILS